MSSLSKIVTFTVKVAYLLDSPILSLFDNLMHMLFFWSHLLFVWSLNDFKLSLMLLSASYTINQYLSWNALSLKGEFRISLCNLWSPWYMTKWLRKGSLVVELSLVHNISIHCLEYRSQVWLKTKHNEESVSM
jgi:hypothetical protein